MAKLRIAVFSAVILAALLFVLIPHHTVKASGGEICIGTCVQTFTPQAQCVAGGTATPPFTVHPTFAISTQAWDGLGPVSGCQATIEYLDVSLAGNVSTGSAVLVTATQYTGGTCPNAMTGTTELWSHSLAISSNTKADHYITPIGGLFHTPAADTSLCIAFSGAVTNAYETMNFIGSYQ